jgi:hypothetical protein
MSISINSHIVAEANIQNVYLCPALGAYELRFHLRISVKDASKNLKQFSISGARISAKGNSGKAKYIGYAFPEKPLNIRQKTYDQEKHYELFLNLTQNQICNLETLRDGSDLSFDVVLIGEGYAQQEVHQIQDELRNQIPRSNWLEMLAEGGARNVILLEIPIPFEDSQPEWEKITTTLEKAETYYRNGDYIACVSNCRTVIQELGFHRFKDKEWHVDQFNNIKNNRPNMTKDERETALWALLRHYTHQAHHGESEGGVVNYGRSDAQMALSLTAAFVAHSQNFGSIQTD